MARNGRNDRRRRRARAFCAPRWTRFGALLAMFALLLQSAIALQYPVMAAGVRAGIPSPSWQDADRASPDRHAAHCSESEKQGGPAHKGHGCPICLTLQQAGTFIAPAEAGVVFALRSETACLKPVVRPWPDDRTFPAARPRAPPATA